MARATLGISEFSRAGATSPFRYLPGEGGTRLAPPWHGYLFTSGQVPRSPGPDSIYMSDAGLGILIVDQNVARAAILEEGLRDAGYANVTVVRDMQNLQARIVNSDPDVIFIDLENPNRDVLEQMFQVSRSVRRPVAMFVDQSDSATIEAAIDAGVSAYIVDGLKKERVQSILHTTISRFKAFDRLRQELDKTKQALQERKLIDRAKGILMKERGLDEESAYGLMRRAAMNENLRLVEVAQSVVTASQLLR